MKKILFVANLKKDKDLIHSKEIINSLFDKGIKVFVDAEEYESLTEEDKLLYSNTHGIEVAYVKDNKYLTEQ